MARNICQISKEKCFIHVIFWFCVFSIYYQLRNQIEHYNKETVHNLNNEKSNIFNFKTNITLTVSSFSSKKDLNDKKTDDEDYTYLDETPVELLNFDYVDSTANDSEVLKWFDARKQFTPIKMHRNHPYIPEYIAPENLCRKTPHIIIYLHSRPGHTSKRRVIRNTWANNDIFKHIVIERIFLLGRVEDVNDMGDAEEEAKKYNDIIIGNFDDTFRNLSLKGLILLDFVNKRCSGAKYMLKADDDFFVNMFLVVEKIISSIWEKEKAVVCHVKENSPADTRNVKGRWYIDPKFLKDSKKLPKFCSGYTVIFSTDLVPEMLNNSLSKPLILVDDVYMFGFLLQNVKGVNMINAYHSFTLNQNAGLEEYIDEYKLIEHISVMTHEESASRKIWNASLNRLTPLGKRMISFEKFKKKS